MSCLTPGAHPEVETWDPARGVHTTTSRECCRPDPFAPDGVYPPLDEPEDD